MDYRMSVPRTVWTERHSHEISLKRVEAILSAPDVSSTLNYFEHFAFVVISPWRLGKLHLTIFSDHTSNHVSEK